MEVSLKGIFGRSHRQVDILSYSKPCSKLICAIIEFSLRVGPEKRQYLYNIGKALMFVELLLKVTGCEALRIGAQMRPTITKG